MRRMRFVQNPLILGVSAAVLLAYMGGLLDGKPNKQLDAIARGEAMLEAHHEAMHNAGPCYRCDSEVPRYHRERLLAAVRFVAEHKGLEPIDGDEQTLVNFLKVHDPFAVLQWEWSGKFRARTFPK